MTKQDEILNEVREIKLRMSWLYGKNGFEGDIPEIKKLLCNYGRRIRIIEIMVAGITVSGGGIWGLTKLLG